MFRFLKSHLTSPEKILHDDLNDFVQFEKTLPHGFPINATAFACDCISRILAVGTQNGEVTIFGGENVMWHGILPNRTHIAHMYFAEGMDTLVVLGNDQTFHRIRIVGDMLDILSHHQEQRLKRITSCTMTSDVDRTRFQLLIGTVTGNIYSLDIETFQMSENILFEENLSSRISLIRPDCTNVNGLDTSQKFPNKLVILLDQTVVIYNTSLREITSSWSLDGMPTCVSWSDDGCSIVVSFVDGSYGIWSETGDLQQKRNIIFGPFPCMPVQKTLMANLESGSLLAFSGGMPRASYGDRYTVTTKRDGRIVCWDFASPVTDFAFFNDNSDLNSNSSSKGLFMFVLTENELVCLDLMDKDWRPVPLKCLFPLHASQITAMVHVDHVEPLIWKEIMKATQSYWESTKYSPSGWPIQGAVNPDVSTTDDIHHRQLLLTGHASGTVRMWTAGEVTMQLLLEIETAREFEGFHEQETQQKEKELYDTDSDSDCFISDEWPPFKKVGIYDPFCDDARLAVQRICFDPKSGSIGIGGRGGHLIVYQLADSSKDCEAPSVLTATLVKDLSVLQLAIRNQKGLPARSKTSRYLNGYQPRPVDDSNASLIMQLSPCVTITALAITDSRSLVTAGNEFGFAVFDYKSSTVVHSQTLLNADELGESGTLDDALSRFKSMKKSIRQSFRRKKRADSKDTTLNTDASSSHGAAINGDDEICRPIERRIEARDSPGQGAEVSSKGLVRLLRFLPNPLITTATPHDSLWVGTNAGHVLVYSIHGGAHSSNKKDSQVCRLEREIRLQHGAPLVDIEIVAESSKHGSSLRLLLITEEQIRGYTLPNLKPTKYKLKLTAMEGIRVRKSAVVRLQSNTDAAIWTHFLCLLTNTGEVNIFSLNNCRKRVRYSLVKGTDVVGMSSVVFTSIGECLWLRPGGSQLQRCALSYHTMGWQQRSNSTHASSANERSN